MSLEHVIQGDIRRIRRQKLLTRKEVNKPMLDIPTKEFNDLFRRLAVDVDLKNRTTVEEINEAIRHTENLYEKLARQARKKTGKGWNEVEKQFWANRKKLRNMRQKGVADRTVLENRRGNRNVRRVLRYGLDETLERNLEEGLERTGRVKKRRKRRRQ